MRCTSSCGVSEHWPSSQHGPPVSFTQVSAELCTLMESASYECRHEARAKRPKPGNRFRLESKLLLPRERCCQFLRYVHDVLKWARRRPLSFRRYLSQFRCVSRKAMKAGGKGQHPCFTYTPLQIRTDFLYNRRIESGLCRYSWPALPWQFSHPWVLHNNPGMLCPDAMFETIR
jgi:hypothetical protein